MTQLDTPRSDDSSAASSDLAPIFDCHRIHSSAIENILAKERITAVEGCGDWSYTTQQSSSSTQNAYPQASGLVTPDSHDKKRPPPPSRLFIGTSRGMVYALDDQAKEIGAFCLHTKAVRDLSVDSTGYYFASCSDDGQVQVQQLPKIKGNTPKAPWTKTFNKPVLTVAINPDFALEHNQIVCCGGEENKLYLMRKRTFDDKSQVLHSGEGVVSSIKWRKSLVAWANAKGVKVFDLNTLQRLAFVPKPEVEEEGATSSSSCNNSDHCTIAWGEDDLLFISWGQMVKVARIRDTPGIAGVKFMEIVSSIHAESVVSGLALFEPGSLSIVTTGKSSSCAQHAVCDWNTGEQLFADELPLRAANSASDVHLLSVSIGEASIVHSPSDILLLRRRTVSDHAMWLLGRGRCEEALIVAQKGPPGLALSICRSCIDHLLENDEADRAALLVPQLRLKSANAWTQVVSVFQQHGAACAIADCIPVGKETIIKDSPRKPIVLSSDLYDKILAELVEKNHKKLLGILNRWPSSIYSVQKLKHKILSAAERPGGEALRHALAVLLSAEGDHAGACATLLDMNLPAAFDLMVERIETEQMQSIVCERVADFCKLDLSQFCSLLAGNTRFCKVKPVVAAFQEKAEKRHLHAYLKAVFDVEPAVCRDFHQDLIELYGEFEPQNLVSVLRRTDGYDQEITLAQAKKLEIHDAQVYLLGQLGRTREAFEILLQLSDIPGAVKFLAEHPDNDMWEELAQHALNHPVALGELLAVLEDPRLIGLDREAVSFPDIAAPSHLLRILPRGQQVPGLTQTVLKVLDDVQARISLYESCGNVLQKETDTLAARLFSYRHGGLFVDPFDLRLNPYREEPLEILRSGTLLPDREPTDASHADGN
eukprot:gene1334-379_t